ncbi:MAG: 16S rRNA (cytidine(1402)-2'-O)-methyltransferase [Bacteroidia bacterium]|jgi:16S rRNA (cytidine1402-2'-O)-methyltransferase|nr:16S rRNA (cytidine(1402)-2'-O)-methyltransferase [Bacteroidia bacterium]MCC6767460.1 16S rRNA (cytidine(1402)-2'-O)-methyltransferase [Bacteroidia bacterium]
MAKLVLVPGPVGNLGDITLRALEVLKTADFILAEDTRTSANLLRHFDINTPLKPFHQHNEHKVLGAVVRQIQASVMVALMSDAGTPGISDPGFLLVRRCIAEGIEVECLPGPTALIPALVVSGLPSDRFFFEGFLPHKKGRQTRLKQICELDCTVVMYESPHRLVKLIDELRLIAGEQRQAAVVREISKVFEECKRGTLLELSEYFHLAGVKGEIVVVLSAAEGRTNKKKA